MARSTNLIFEQIQQHNEAVAQAMSDYIDDHNDKLYEAANVSDEERARLMEAEKEKRQSEQQEKQAALNAGIAGWEGASIVDDVSMEAHAKVYEEMQEAVKAERSALSGQALEAYDVVNPATPAEEQKPTRESYDLVCFAVDIAKGKESVKADLLSVVSQYGLYGHTVDAVLYDVERMQKLEAALRFFQEADKRKKINL